MATRARAGGIGLDMAAACALALGLSLLWAMRDWPALSRLHLPDTDDAVRLQQVRDWITGQLFADMSQHRLGGGLAMHWSRIADLIPAGVIVALTSLIGRHAAELVAILVYPAALLAAALFLIGRIARAIGAGTDAMAAIVVAALAFPTTTLFVPGRIDHHALQIVLLLTIVWMLLRPGSVRSGAVAGIAAVASLVIGLETALFIAIAGVAAIGLWVRSGSGSEQRLLGFGAAAIIGLILARAIFGTWQWAFPGCDGFDAVTWRAAMIVAIVPLALAIIGRWFLQPPRRLVLAIVIGTAGVVAALAVSPTCLSPYGGVAPELARLWLGRVGEAQPLLAASPAVAIGYAGLLVVGIIATALHLRRERPLGWALLLALQLAALALSFAQLRGAYAGAILAAPALAVTIGRARARGRFLLMAAWLVSAGTLYPLAANALIPDKPLSSNACATPDALDRLAALPPGTVIAPMDFGAYGLAATPHNFVAGPYHRNNSGNLAMYRFFLWPPDAAHRIAARWHVDYVVSCPGAPDWPGAAPQGSLAAQLKAGNPPVWLAPLPGPTPTLYAVRR